MNLITPVHGKQRISLHVSDEDRDKVTSGLARRDGKWTATVTDIPTGKVYNIMGAACGLGCHCDAAVAEGVIAELPLQKE